MNRRVVYRHDFGIVRVSPEGCQPKLFPLASLAVCSVIVAACGTHAQKPVAPERKRVNVLFVSLDTTRADHLACYRSDLPRTGQHRSAETPNLDALAVGGARFTHAVAEVPLTLPSHASMFTGVYPPFHVRGQ